MLSIGMITIFSCSKFSSPNFLYLTDTNLFRQANPYIDFGGNV